MAKKITSTAGTPATNGREILPWEDVSTDLSTEQDNRLVEEVLGGFRNLDSIQIASGLPYLGLDKAGSWKYGQDAVEPEHGSYWAMDLPTARWGHIAWVDGKPAGEFMTSISESRKTHAELDAGLPWQDQVSIEMLCVSGEEKGTRVLFKTSSVGGVKAFMAYKDACKREIPRDPSKPIAVVQLETTTYHHAKYGKISNPVFKVCGWATMGILRVDEGDSGPDGAPKAAPAEATVEQPAGVSARRRRVGAE